ncbi:MAG TPA: helix-turn-helix domain-containing protein [Capsulimonadaceae bacterium]|nr:helix-turn-helix domain-containing protein [Capsulimonadaceae bacterium]
MDKDFEDFPLLERIGLNMYDRRALVTLLRKGIAEASTLCEEGDVPTSKIYQSMEKLAAMGLVEVQPTRPRLFAALSVEDVANRVAEIAKEEAAEVARGAEGLVPFIKDTSTGGKSGRMFADLAVGVGDHVRRHLAQLAGANQQIVSYMEATDLAVLRAASKEGFPILKRIARNSEEKGISHRVVFGFTHRTAPDLIEFLREYHAEVAGMTGIRFAGELGQPFHIIDSEVVILCLDNAFLPERRFASLLIRNEELARALMDGFDQLWAKAMKSLQEIDAHPDFGKTAGPFTAGV